jgi:hypothetical protein
MVYPGRRKIGRCGWLDICGLKNYRKKFLPVNEMNDTICYCFEYTRQDIEEDFKKNGRSLIMEKIKAEKKFGNCRCTEKNPKGG